MIEAEATDLIHDLRVDGSKVMVSSRIMAERFGKRHTDVLRSIRAQAEDIPEEFNQRNFASVNFVDKKGQERPEVLMTRDGFMLVAMSLTGAEATRLKVAFIGAFRAMETMLQEGGAAPGYVRGLEEQVRFLRGLVKAAASDGARSLIRRKEQLKMERREDSGQLTLHELITRMLAEGDDEEDR